jgi:hypothetical protein
MKNAVIPAKLVPAGSKQGAGIQKRPKRLDSRFHGNDPKRKIKIENLI